MYQYKVKEIKRIVDGDTVDVIIDLGFGIFHSHRVRLKDLDAPETRTLDMTEKQKGLASKEWLAQELTNDKVWVIETDKDDKYGRILGTFTEQGSQISLNQKMLDGGFAEPYLP